MNSTTGRNLLVLILLGVCMHIGLRVQDGHNWGGDFSLYIAQTIAVLDGSIESLREANLFTSLNSSKVLGPVLYPIGFPILLCPIYKLFGLNFIAMKLFSSTFLLLSLLVSYLLFRKELNNELVALLLVAIIGFHKQILKYSDHILSDFPFLCFSLVTIFLITRKITIWRYFLIGVFIFLSVSIRYVGIVLIPTLVIQQLVVLRKPAQRTPQALLQHSTPYVVFGVLYVLSSWIYEPGYGIQVDLMSRISIEKVTANFWRYLNFLSNFFLGNIAKGSFWAGLFAAIVFIPLCLKGVVESFKNHTVLAVYPFIYIIALILWPSSNGIRLLIPAIPFLIFLIAKGLLSITRFKHFKLTLIAFLTLLFFNMTSESVRSTYSAFNRDTNNAFSDEMKSHYNYIDNQVGENQVIGFFKPRVLRLFTNRNSYYNSENDYDPKMAQFALVKNSEQIRFPGTPVHRTDNYTLYKLN